MDDITLDELIEWIANGDHAMKPRKRQQLVNNIRIMVSLYHSEAMKTLRNLRQAFVSATPDQIDNICNLLKKGSTHD